MKKMLNKTYQAILVLLLYMIIIIACALQVKTRGLNVDLRSLYSSPLPIRSYPYKISLCHVTSITNCDTASPELTQQINTIIISETKQL